MALTLFDFILIGIMVISGLLALMRGFTREALSLMAWGLAAVATYFALKQEKVILWTMENVPYLDKDIFAKIGVGAAVFLVVLIIVSIISVKISDYVVDSSAGAFDRSLGFIFGLARGFVLVVIAFLFYGWFLPFEKQEKWVREAMSIDLVKRTGEKLVTLLPPDIAETLFNTALLKNPAEDKDDAQPAQPPEPGYQNNEAQGLENLIEGTGATTEQPTFGQSTSQ